MNFDDFNLTEDQKDKVKTCKTPEELLALAKAEGYELSEAQLDNVAGGWGTECEYFYPEELCATYRLQ